MCPSLVEDIQRYNKWNYSRIQRVLQVAKQGTVGGKSICLLWYLPTIILQAYDKEAGDLVSMCNLGKPVLLILSFPGCSECLEQGCFQWPDALKIFFISLDSPTFRSWSILTYLRCKLPGLISRTCTRPFIETCFLAAGQWPNSSSACFSFFACVVSATCCDGSKC